jgi:hypothetical protein
LVLQFPPILTAVRNSNNGSTFSDYFLLTGAEEGAHSIRADYKRGVIKGSTFSSPSGASIV